MVRLSPVLILFLAVGCGGHSSRPQAITTAPGPHEALPASDSVAFLQKCLERYDADHITGYHLVMSKQERVNGDLHEPEVIQVAFRVKPYCVLMHWVQGAGPAASVLYVHGENNGKMLVHPKGLVGEFVKDVERDPEGSQARAAGRYSITQFGLKKTLERTLRDWQHAQEQGTLHAKYLGIREVSEAGKRPCYTLRRTSAQPDQNGITEVTVYIDQETWFQVGTILRGPGGALLGEYFYRDIQLNPTFKPNQFTAKGLTGR